MTETFSIFDFDNSFALEMDGFYADIEAERAPKPELLLLNEVLARELNIDPIALRAPEAVDVFAGNEVPSGAQPLAQAYAGHQFGGFSPSLGDGRALLLGEVIDTSGTRRDIQLKGSGRTPFSRNGDGKAALAPVLREYLFGEAMHALGVPTTRSLAAILTGEMVYREKPLPGAVLTRVASSHLRVGTFQFFAARGQTDKVKQLADYAINRHDPDIADDPEKYLIFLDRVTERQTKLIAKWMSIGFIHGVMNTDNMTISGETIDYGPCAFMDTYHPDRVFSSIDDHGRYAYKMQPVIAQWNLARLAEALLELIAPDDKDAAVKLATERIEQVPGIYQQHWLGTMGRKLGLVLEKKEDAGLINDFLAIMEKEEIDFTQGFAKLAASVEEKDPSFTELFRDTETVNPWLDTWRKRLRAENNDLESTMALMQTANPIYIPRNHHVERVLHEAVEENDLAPFEEFFNLLQTPYDRQAGMENFETGAPSNLGPHITYCGT